MEELLCVDDWNAGFLLDKLRYGVDIYSDGYCVVGGLILKLFGDHLWILDVVLISSRPSFRGIQITRRLFLQFQ